VLADCRRGLCDPTRAGLNVVTLTSGLRGHCDAAAGRFRQRQLGMPAFMRASRQRPLRERRRSSFACMSTCSDIFSEVADTQPSSHETVARNSAFAGVKLEQLEVTRTGRRR